MGRNNHYKIVVFNGRITDIPELRHLRGKKLRHRDLPLDGSLGLVYGSTLYISQDQIEGYGNWPLHEYGHIVDKVYGEK
ncbi:hypothetical protein CMO93_01045 [Candidatus Woesearchaeota archaeon]|nr:hypothetical protein [Candidatus Woesearchaeota archaeon]